MASMKPPGWLVVIGASAGGVEALRVLFRHLPANLDAAFLVVVHIPPHSPSLLDRVLADVTDMPSTPAVDGALLQQAHVYTGSADMHLMVEDGAIRLTRGPKECRVRPAVDVLFRSAATSYGARVIGVVLSGMLDDGTSGLWTIKDHRGITLVQEPAEAMHPSMPESAIHHVEVDFVGPCADLAAEIRRRLSRPVPEIAVVAKQRAEIETKIASEGNALQLGVMKLGNVSQYTCPDCHGVLVQIDEGSIVRFRCHTGHAYSLKALLADVNVSIDKGLWDTTRAIEERVLLLRQMSDIADANSPAESASFRKLADEAEVSLKPLKAMVLDPRIFGRQG